MKLVLNCLEDFCKVSCQKISCAKSRTFFSRHTAREVKSLVAKLTNIPSSEDPGKYLSFNLFMDGRGNQNYRYILQRMKNRLNFWKAKTLSLASKVTLVKSVMNALPNYQMQIMRFSKFCCEEMDRINRDFIWQGSISQRKVHIVNWDTLCKPKKMGVLVLGDSIL